MWHVLLSLVTKTACLLFVNGSFTVSSPPCERKTLRRQADGFPVAARGWQHSTTGRNSNGKKVWSWKPIKTATINRKMYFEPSVYSLWLICFSCLLGSKTRLSQRTEPTGSGGFVTSSKEVAPPFVASQSAVCFTVLRSKQNWRKQKKWSMESVMLSLGTTLIVVRKLRQSEFFLWTMKESRCRNTPESRCCVTKAVFAWMRHKSNSYSDIKVSDFFSLRNGNPVRRL